MPNRDVTGPRNGQGRGTGRGRGNCRRNVEVKNENIIYGKCDGTGKGFGRKNRHS